MPFMRGTNAEFAGIRRQLDEGDLPGAALPGMLN